MQSRSKWVKVHSNTSHVHGLVEALRSPEVSRVFFEFMLSVADASCFLVGGYIAARHQIRPRGHNARQVRQTPLVSLVAN